MEIKFSKIVKIIPTYNEKDNIAALVPALFKHMPQSSILVVDDNSPDGTSQAVLDLKKDYPSLDLHLRLDDKGFGRSYIDGFKKVIADGHDAVVMLDADFSHDPAAIPGMVEALAKYDLIIGSRYVKGGGIKNWNLKRRVLSRFANFYARTILGLKVKDMTTGFMCFKGSILDELDLNSIRSDGYAFLVELKYRIIKAGFNTYEYPIIFNERREGQSKMSAKIIWESIWLPWKLRF